MASEPAFVPCDVRGEICAQAVTRRQAQRVVALSRAREFVGARLLAAGMAITERTLRSYTDVERGLPPARMIAAAETLEARAAAMLAHAARLRELGEAE